MKTETTKQIFALIFIVILLSFTSALTIENVDSTPNQIAPGETADIKITVENTLGEDLEKVMVNLDLSQVPFAPYGSGTSKVIEEIDDEDEESMNFGVRALSDADARIYKIPVVFSYQFNDSIVSTQPSFISLIINTEPELETSYTGNLIKGKNNEITIRVTNTGLTEAKFLEIELRDSANIKVIGSKKVYIGNIESDDFDSVDFNIFVDTDTSSLTTIPITLRYRDAINKDYTEIINLQVKTYTTKEAIELGLIGKNNTLVYLTLIIVVIVLWLIYRKLKKSKRKKKEA